MLSSARLKDIDPFRPDRVGTYGRFQYGDGQLVAMANAADEVFGQRPIGRGITVLGPISSCMEKSGVAGEDGMRQGDVVLQIV